MRAEWDVLLSSESTALRLAADARDVAPTPFMVHHHSNPRFAFLLAYCYFVISFGFSIAVSPFPIFHPSS